MYEITKISETDFLNRDGNLLFEADFPRCYGRLIINGLKVYLSWRSDVISPEVLLDEKHDILVVSIDTFCSIISLRYQKGFKSLETLFNIIETFIYKRALFVFTEMEVLEYDFNGVLLKSSPLMEIYDTFKILGENIEIYMVGGQTQVISISGSNYTSQHNKK